MRTILAILMILAIPAMVLAQTATSTMTDPSSLISGGVQAFQAGHFGRHRRQRFLGMACLLFCVIR